MKLGSVVAANDAQARAAWCDFSVGVRAVDEFACGRSYLAGLVVAAVVNIDRE
jgi:hypothetical protein